MNSIFKRLELTETDLRSFSHDEATCTTGAEIIPCIQMSKEEEEF